MLQPAPPAELGVDADAPVQARRPRALRRSAARGMLVNAGFTIGLAVVGLVENFVLAHLVSRHDYGLWGVLVVTLATLVTLKQVGIGDRYVQQEEADQEAAFQKAFTLELGLSAALGLLMAALLPLLALVYHTRELLVPGAVMALTILVSAFESPQWIFYRRMDYTRQRLLGAVSPVLGAVVAITLGLLGAGYWAFVGGLACGAAAAALVSVAASPYALQVRREPGVIRDYAGFSAPLLLASAGTLLMSWAALLVTKLSLGLPAVGVVTLAATLQAFTDSVDQLVTGTLYPAICAVRERTELLRESFIKTNRLALMFAVPFGIALSLFAGDLVRFGIGQRWHPVVLLLEVGGVVAALNHVGFNWGAYLRAQGWTRPIAISSWAAAGAFLATGVPLLILIGLPGFAVGVAAQAATAFALRLYFLRRVFPRFSVLRHLVRALLPTVPAAAVILLARQLEPGRRTFSVAVIELAGYLLLTALATWWAERALLREALLLLARRA